MDQFNDQYNDQYNINPTTNANPPPPLPIFVSVNGPNIQQTTKNPTPPPSPPVVPPPAPMVVSVPAPTPVPAVAPPSVSASAPTLIPTPTSTSPVPPSASSLPPLSAPLYAPIPAPSGVFYGSLKFLELPPSPCPHSFLQGSDSYDFGLELSKPPNLNPLHHVKPKPPTPPPKRGPGRPKIKQEEEEEEVRYDEERSDSKIIILPSCITNNLPLAASLIEGRGCGRPQVEH